MTRIARRTPLNGKPSQHCWPAMPSYEETVSREGKWYLCATTPIPVGMEKCVMCHENYRDKKIVGAIGSILPLE